jgi:HPt (histidine-containing phosphotransfer) domain-containing protein
MSTTQDREGRGNGAARGEEPILDQGVLQSLEELGGDDDPDLFVELIDLFLQDAPHRIDELRRGLEQGDVKLLERAAHTLKSSSANVGALPLSALCKRMEEHARRNVRTELPDLLERALRMWSRVEAALRATRSQRTDP